MTDTPPPGAAEAARAQPPTPPPATFANEGGPAQLTVRASPAADQLKAAVRALLIAVGGYVAGRGWIPADIATALVPVILIGGPVIWAQLEARLKKRQLVAVAVSLPADVTVRP